MIIVKFRIPDFLGEILHLTIEKIFLLDQFFFNVLVSLNLENDLVPLSFEVIVSQITGV